MLSKNKIKYLCSLQRKKNREAYKLFIAEGKKLVCDLLDAGLKAQIAVCTENSKNALRKYDFEELIEVDIDDIKKISLLKTTPDVFAVFHKTETPTSLQYAKNTVCICLDGIQDPGNLGTIIRTADWFGIRNIICVNGCAEAYNPKTVQSTMGAIARVAIHYSDVPTIEQQFAGLPIYGCYMEGENIFSSELTQNGLIVMGNEGQGISEAMELIINKKISIPSYAEGRTSESLNVATAAAITMAEFKRRQ